MNQYDFPKIFSLPIFRLSLRVFIAAVIIADFLTISTMTVAKHLNPNVSCPIYEINRNNSNIQLTDPITNIPISTNPTSKRVLILIQGWSTSTAPYDQKPAASQAAEWRDLLSYVADNYSKVAFFSYNPQSEQYVPNDTFDHDPIAYQSPRLGSLIRACGDVLPSDFTFDIIGHSMGGLIAWNFAKQNAEQNAEQNANSSVISRVRHVVTLDSPVNGLSIDYSLGNFNIIDYIRGDDFYSNLYELLVPTIDLLSYRFIPNVRLILDVLGLSDSMARQFMIKTNGLKSPAASTMIALSKETGLGAINCSVAQDLAAKGVVVRTYSSSDDLIVNAHDARIDGYARTFELGRYGSVVDESHRPNPERFKLSAGHSEILSDDRSLFQLQQDLFFESPGPTLPGYKCISVVDSTVDKALVLGAGIGGAFAPQSVVVGSSVTMGAVFKNIGTNAWAAGSYSIRSVDDGRSVWGTKALTQTISPFQNLSVFGTIFAPSTPGLYVYSLSLVNANGKRFITSPPIYLQVVAAATPTPILTQAPSRTPTALPIASPTPQPMPGAPFWRQTFYSDLNFATPCGNLRFSDKHFEFESSAGDWTPPSGCPAANQSWSMSMYRSVDFPGGDISFMLFADDWAELTIDGVATIPNNSYQTYSVPAGARTIRLRYNNYGGRARVQFAMRGPGFLPQNQVADPNQWQSIFYGIRKDGPDDAAEPAVIINAGGGFLNYNWGDSGPGFGIQSDQFSMRFERRLDFPCGTYRFNIASDDGYRLRIEDANGKALTTGFPDRYDGSSHFEYLPLDGSGIKLDGLYKLTLDYLENGGGALLSLNWVQLFECPPPPASTPIPVSTSTPTVTPVPSRTPVPDPCPTTAGWRARYWNSTDPDPVDQPVLCRDEQSIQYDWGANSPGPGVNADQFTAEWDQTITMTAGKYRFFLTHDDGARLMINGWAIYRFDCEACIIENATVDVTVLTGNYRIVYHVTDNFGSASAKLRYELISESMTPTPSPHIPTATHTATVTATSNEAVTPVPTSTTGLGTQQFRIFTPLTIRH